MALSSSLNTTYRPSSPNVTQKYTPLNNIQVSTGDTTAVQQIANGRIGAITSMGIRVDRLTFLADHTIDWYASREQGNNSPLVVVSSNRSAWIKNCYENAEGILSGITPAVTNFNSVMDTRALQAGAVPFYIPIRMTAVEAATRNVYIFVAADEYNEYRTNLKDTGITVIGWRTDGEAIAGFGASRYAALEFFKYINRTNGASASIWMLDDNVAYIRAFPGLAVVEGQLGTSYGLGFKGSTQVSSDSTFTAMSQNAQPAAAAATAHEKAPILQQAVLWNVNLFNASNYTFSPYFITSAEDTSLTKFLGQDNCQFYGGCEIFKGMATYDNTIKVRALQGAKNLLIDYCYKAPPAIAFTSDVVSGAKTLGEVIIAARDADTSPPKISGVASEETVGQTYSKAVEQILSAALDKKIALPAAVFTLTAPPQITSKLMPKI